MNESEALTIHSRWVVTVDPVFFFPLCRKRVTVWITPLSLLCVYS